MFFIEIALEEYENLKRLPDPRQIALQRFQDQQRLNTHIAQQHQLAAARMQQLPPNLHQALQQMNENGTRFDFARMIQQIQAMRSTNGLQNKKTTGNNEFQSSFCSSFCRYFRWSSSYSTSTNDC